MLRNEHYFVHTSPQNDLNWVFTGGKYVVEGSLLSACKYNQRAF